MKRFGIAYAIFALCFSASLMGQIEIPAPKPAPKGSTRDTKGMSNSGSFQAAQQEMEAEERKSNPFGTVGDQAVTFSKSITGADIAAHLNFLASDELEGRETATRGQKIAARYLAAQFQKMGLKPGGEKGSWYQNYELIQVQINEVSISFNGKEQYKMGKDFAFFNKAAMAESFDADLAFAGYGIEADAYNNLQGLDLVGKAVLVLSGEPMKGEKPLLSDSEEASEWADMRTKLKALKEAGARAVLFVLEDDNFKRFSGSPWMRHMMKGKSLNLAYRESGSLPNMMIPDRLANELIKKSKRTMKDFRRTLNGSPKVQKVDFKKNRFWLTSDAQKDTVIAENVLGMIEGTSKKNEVVVLTAHYDHLGVKDGKIYNGADDDGTGTASILEIAEAFAEAAKQGVRPRRSILFMPVSGEEKGLLGSRYYTDHPVYPLKKTVCNLNIDMIGRLDKAHEGNSNYVYIIGSDKLSTDLHRANERANERVTQLELDYTYNAPDDPNRFYYRSDHYNFAKHDIPVIFYFTGVHEDYHKHTDTVDKVDMEKTAKIARLVFGTAWEVANAKQRLRVDRKNDMPME